MAKVSNVLTKEDLASYIQTIILEIRNNSNGTFASLQKDLKELKQYENKLSKQSDVLELFNSYKKLQVISLQLRQLLSKYIDLETYDKITYAFYYNGQRYETDNIDARWLSKSSKSGELKLNLKYATDDLSNAYAEEYEQRVRDAFDQHFSHYSDAIIGTYRGVIGRGGALNKGHIAEAYESHTREHHPLHYRLLNHLFNSPIPEEPIPQLIQYTNHAEAVKYWAEHESIDSAWQHIRESFGTQRGTVAGDVGGMQVKGSTSNARRIRIARLNTLIQGVEAYSMILNPNVPAHEVALLIADYMSEPVRKVSDRIIDEVSDKLIKDQFGQYNKKLELKAYVRI